MNYSFSLTSEQLYDFFKKFRTKTVKFFIIMSVVFFVVGAAFFVWHFLDEKVDMIVGALIMIIAGILLIVCSVGINKSTKTQSDVYFRSCQTDGIINYEYQLCEKEFVVSIPERGNVNHYYYDLIIKVTELDGYASVLLEGNQCLPVLVNEETRPMIETFKSVAKQKSK